jgi:hypothetical protein
MHKYLYTKKYHRVIYNGKKLKEPKGLIRGDWF